MNEGESGLPLNDETDYGLCFVCGPRNRSGLRLRFEREGGVVTTTFRGREEHQGFPGYVHGGVITALLDETMSRVSLLEDRWTMTARMEVRFRRPVPVDQPVTAVAEKLEERRGFVEAAGARPAARRHGRGVRLRDLRVPERGVSGGNERGVPAPGQPVDEVAPPPAEARPT